MKKLRGVFLALGLFALIGLAARESRAETITMTLTWSGGSLTFDNTSAVFALPGSSDTALLVNTPILNSTLSGDGLAVNFSSLGASSDFPGASSPGNATIALTGNANLSGTGSLTAISITVTETGFSAPTGSGGTLGSAQGGAFTNVASNGNVVASSSFNALSTASLTYPSTLSSLPVSYSGSNSLGVGSVASGFTLGNSAALNFGSSTGGASSTVGFTVAATLTAVVPEPASIVMMLTGMPLPLAVVGLLRRRRSAA